MRLVATFILTLSLLPLVHAQKRTLRKSNFKQDVVSSDWVVVKYKDLNKAVQKHPERTHELIHRKKTSEKPSTLDGWVKVKIENNQHPVDACNALLEDELVLVAEPMRSFELFLEVTDPLAEDQYYLDNIEARRAWDITQGDDDITIGIIDTGLDLDHPDLVNNIWTNDNDPIDGVDNDGNGYVDDYLGYDFSDSDNDAEADQNFHGVEVGGVAGAIADNEEGIAGIGFNTKIAALKGFQSETGTSAGLYDAIIYAADNGIEVLNLSWGSKGSPYEYEQSVIDYVVLEKDVVVVAAAGNDGNKESPEAKFYPASYDHVLSVAGTLSDDEKWSGSSYNRSVDLSAPAASIVTTTGNNGYKSLSSGGAGTSLAAPMVAATAALVRDQFPELSAVQVMERIRTTADDIYDVGNNSQYDGKLGKGRLNSYRAVSESNVKSLRATSPGLSSTHQATSVSDYVFFGDTVNVVATLVNYLDPVSDPQVYISSVDGEFSVSQGVFLPGPLNTLDSSEVAFEIYLSEDLEPETSFGIRLDYTDGSYSDFQFVDVTTSPDYVDFGLENVALTYSGNGNIGYESYGLESIGSGFLYGSDTIMHYAGLLVTDHSQVVYDNVINQYSTEARDQDFVQKSYYKLYQHPGADLFGYTELSTDNGLIIEQSNIAYEGENSLITRYRLVNSGEESLIDLAMGLFTDWSLTDYTSNFAELDTINDYLFTRNADATLYAAVQIISDADKVYSALDMGTYNGNVADIGDGFTDALKYYFLQTENPATAGLEGAGNDVATLSGISKDTLAPGDGLYVNVILAVGETRDALEQSLENAQEYLLQFIETPRVQETFITCDGLELVVDPNGESFEFYEDPYGRDLISTGDSLVMSSISSDTTIYIRNIDNGYPSEIFALRINQFNDISQFSSSVDTLYLDHSTTNIVSFTDESIGAISWLWDFGQGTSTTKQHPSVSFDEPGEYTIALTVENKQGCEDVQEHVLLVTNRPEAPTIETQEVCYGGDIELTVEQASSLKIYTFEDQINPTAEGASLIEGPFYADTTLWVSAVYDGFESKKAEVLVDVKEMNAGFEVLPDTTSVDHRMQLTSLANGNATSTWTIDGEAKGAGSSISIEANAGDVAVVLTIEQASCSFDVSKDVSISTSIAPKQGVLTSCNGDSVTFIPENGTYFGFYEDENQTQLIHKGTQLTTNAYEKVYIVGLDDGLPGAVIESTVEQLSFQVSIDTTTSSIGNEYRVELSSASEGIVSYLWFLDGELLETTPDPAIVLGAQPYTIALMATSADGCVATDTLVLDFTPHPVVLGVQKATLEVSPNPTSGRVQLLTPKTIRQVDVLDTSGKKVLQQTSAAPYLDLTSLPAGVYFLEVYTQSDLLKAKVVVD